MPSVDRIDTVQDYNASVGMETRHPLVNVVDFDAMPAYQYFRRYMGIYAVFLKYIHCGDMRYGCQSYDYEEGTLVFIAPGQVYGIEDTGRIIKPRGKALVFHPDLIAGTHLGSHIKEYSFFSYEVNEALHLSGQERSTINDCFNKIDAEIDQGSDHHSKTLIVSNIELFLNYCRRYYDRQFHTRKEAGKDILVRFERLLADYFTSGKARLLGSPTVAYCAEQMHLSANYFGDLIKKETGSTALEYIQSKLINEAKEKMVDPARTINEIADELGFKYQQHFTRLFKQRTGMSPIEYRKHTAT